MVHAQIFFPVDDSQFSSAHPPEGDYIDLHSRDKSIVDIDLVEVFDKVP